ncbi:erythromycin esterase family protein [Flindersiella endophytica]
MTSVGEWLCGNAHRLRTLDPADDDFSDLEPLRDIVGDARVVSIGESTHRVHEFYQLRHRMIRFLVRELGFTAHVMESGFPEGLAVDNYVVNGVGDLDSLLYKGLTYHMGKCEEMREQLLWMRGHNASHQRKVRFYGMDVPGSSATVVPAIEAALTFLDDVDPAYAEAVRARLLPLFDYLPSDRSGLAWAAPAIQAYQALDAACRHELTARIGELTERLQAMRVVYASRAGSPERADVAFRCAATGRHLDAFLAAAAAGTERTYEGANLRDIAMADNVEWILGREDRIVVTAANGHVQRWPFRVPPYVPNELTMLGEHLAASIGERMVVIATTFGGGSLWVHRPIPGGAPGHTESSVEDLGRLNEPGSLDALLAESGMPLLLVPLRDLPVKGAVAERFAEVDSILTGPHRQPVDPLVAFDAVLHIDQVTPWHSYI